MAAAGKQSANMLSRYTGKSFTTDDLKPHHEALKAPVKNVWDVTDRAAYVTFQVQLPQQLLSVQQA